MRQVFFIILLLGSMFFINSIGVSQTEGFDPMLLASIGFIILFAFSMAEISVSAGLPKVTGYIVTGILLGPQVLEVLSKTVVSEIKMFNTLALGLIALSAGLELHLDSLKKVLRTLSITILFKLITLYVLVGGGFYLLQTNFSILPITEPLEVVALSLIFSALSIGTSPAIVLAVISESKVKGRSADIVLGAAVLKDVVVVLALAVSISTARSLISPGGEFDASVFTHLALEILLSMSLGLVLGGIFVLYMKYIAFEMLFFIAGVILAAAELAAMFHLELLLIFICAGFVVSNFSKFEKQLHLPLEKVALPVFVIFFTNAGAAIDIASILNVAVLALAVCILRALAFYLSGYLGARFGGENKVIQQNIWLGYLPQAGVTLGLVGIATSQLPDLSQYIESLGMGVVAINLLSGPILLGLCFRQTTATGVVDDVGIKADLGEITDRTPDKATLPFKDIREEDLRRLSVETYQNVLRIFSDFYRDKVQRKSMGYYSEYMASAEKVEGSLNFNSLNLLSESMRDEAKNCLQVYHLIFQEIDNLPVVRQVNRDKDYFEIKQEDSQRLKFKKIVRKFIKLFDSSYRSKRTVLYRTAWKIKVLPLVVLHLKNFVEGWFRFNFDLHRLRLGVDQEAEMTKEVASSFEKQLQEFVSNRVEAFEFELLKTCEDLSWLIQTTDTDQLKIKEINFSSVEPEITSNLVSLEKGIAQWQENFIAIGNTFNSVVALDQICKTGLSQCRGEYISQVVDVVDDLLKSAIRLLKIKNMIEGVLQIEQPSYFECVKNISSEIQDIESGLDRNLILGRAFNSFRQNYLEEVNRQSSLFEESADLLTEASLKKGVSGFKKVSTQKVDVRLVIDQIFGNELIGKVERTKREIDESLATVVVEILDTIKAVDFSVSAQSSVKDLDGRIADDLKEAVDILGRFELKVNRWQLELKSSFSKKVSEIEEKFSFTEQDILDILYSYRISQKAEGFAQRIAKASINRLRNSMQLKLLFYEKLKKRISLLKENVSESKSSQLIRKKVAENSLSSESVKSYLENLFPVEPNTSIPGIYRKLFSLEGLSDDRLFVPIHPQVERSVARSKVVLVLGDSGVGKTTYLSSLSTKTRGQVLVLDRMNFKRVGLITSLCSEMAIARSWQSLVDHISQNNFSIVIDDLDDWWDAENPQDMYRFFSVVESTRAHASWFLSMKSINFELFSGIYNLSQLADEVVRLKGVTSSQLKRIIEKRHQYSNFDLIFDHNRIGGRLGRFIKFGREEVFYRILAEKCGGNIRFGLYLWLRSLEVDVQKEVIEVFNKENPDFFFLQGFSLNSNLIIKEFLRFGSRTIENLVAQIRLDEPVVVRETLFLERAGILQKRSQYSKEYFMPKVYTAKIQQSLERLGYQGGGL